MAKRSPEEVLDALDAWTDDAWIDAEMERVLASTPEECEARLRAAGIDIEAEAARGRAWREAAQRGDLTELRRLALARLRDAKDG